MKSMGAGEFKAHCLQILEQVRKTRTPLVLTKRGKPVAKLVPVLRQFSTASRAKIEILGDIVSPITPLEHWEALK
jgi:prevent-host-death family protein